MNIEITPRSMEATAETVAIHAELVKDFNPLHLDEAFAAVTVPPSRKAGLSVGIFSGRALAGCSSSVMLTSPLRVLSVTAATSPSNAPELIAARAPSREPMA